MFEITAVTFGLYAAEKLTAADGTAIPVNGLIEIISIEGNGHGTVSTDLPLGSYCLKERATDNHYVLSDEKYPIVFECANQDTALVEIKASNGSKELDAGGKLMGTLTEVSSGVYELAGVEYGGYFVQERTAPEGFRLDKNACYFEIREHGKTVVVENKAGVGFVNDAQAGKLKVFKTSSDGKVEGFSFRVTGTSGYDQVFTTSEAGEIAIEGLWCGLFQGQEDG